MFALEIWFDRRCHSKSMFAKSTFLKRHEGLTYRGRDSKQSRKSVVKYSEGPIGSEGIGFLSSPWRSGLIVDVIRKLIFQNRPSCRDMRVCPIEEGTAKKVERVL